MTISGSLAFECFTRTFLDFDWFFDFFEGILDFAMKTSFPYLKAMAAACQKADGILLQDVFFVLTMKTSCTDAIKNEQEGEGMSEENSSSASVTQTQAKIQEQSLERMEALLKQSAKGIHILFDNISIAKIMSKNFDEKDFFDFNKMKRVQDVMTELIAKKTYFEKVSYLRDLDSESYEMLIRTYFHIVENTVRADNDLSH
jgi:hypothetical protein